MNCSMVALPMTGRAAAAVSPEPSRFYASPI
jgi:hypothetical protein